MINDASTFLLYLYIVLQGLFYEILMSLSVPTSRGWFKSAGQGLYWFGLPNSLRNINFISTCRNSGTWYLIIYEITFVLINLITQILPSWFMDSLGTSPGCLYVYTPCYSSMNTWTVVIPTEFRLISSTIFNFTIHSEVLFSILRFWEVLRIQSPLF